MADLHLDKSLAHERKLYRYVSLEVFINFIETKCTCLTKVNHWDDKWEMILSKVPTLDFDGNTQVPLYSFHQYVFGQCWSLIDESDAMWRIYSPNRNGIRLETSVSKFAEIRGMNRGYLGKVVYFDTVNDLLEKSKVSKHPFNDALFKRSAFRHEDEVRLLTHADHIDQCNPNLTHLSLPLDPLVFVEGVMVDPRADDWYLETIMKYCDRAKLNCIPVRSTLYETDPHLKIGVVRQYLPVNRIADKHE